MDCSPISPGGAHYIPNTLNDHANWAFNAYYLLHRAAQGASACNFGGVASLVAPTNSTLLEPVGKALTFSDFFSNDLVCERV
uniref:X8 domain-containing protein n=1 Tax=Arcella intermedia TaxID=1963864 RepID=A0A6B2LTR4_9EUKA